MEKAHSTSGDCTTLSTKGHAQPLSLGVGGACECVWAWLFVLTLYTQNVKTMGGAHRDIRGDRMYYSVDTFVCDGRMLRTHERRILNLRTAPFKARVSHLYAGPRLPCRATSGLVPPTSRPSLRTAHASPPPPGAPSPRRGLGTGAVPWTGRTGVQATRMHRRSVRQHAARPTRLAAPTHPPYRLGCKGW